MTFRRVVKHIFRPGANEPVSRGWSVSADQPQYRGYGRIDEQAPRLDAARQRIRLAETVRLQDGGPAQAADPVVTVNDDRRPGGGTSTSPSTLGQFPERNQHAVRAAGSARAPTAAGRRAGRPARRLRASSRASPDESVGACSTRPRCPATASAAGRPAPSAASRPPPLRCGRRTRTGADTPWITYRQSSVFTSWPRSAASRWATSTPITTSPSSFLAPLPLSGKVMTSVGPSCSRNRLFRPGDGRVVHERQADLRVLHPLAGQDGPGALLQPLVLQRRRSPAGWPPTPRSSFVPLRRGGQRQRFEPERLAGFGDLVHQRRPGRHVVGQGGGVEAERTADRRCGYAARSRAACSWSAARP